MSLDALWGPTAAELRERIALTRSAGSRLDLLEAFLIGRIDARRSLHPAVAHALARFEGASDVGSVVAEAGLSHRRFLQLFREGVGLPPKLYSRILRFQRAVHLVAGKPGRSWADIALAAGYSDQPHLVHDFAEFAGLAPGRYRKLAPASPNHVPLPAP